jgi:hypothetical protein
MRMGSRSRAPNLNFDFLFLDQVSASAPAEREPLAIVARAQLETPQLL